jgi:hypothetical protein
VLGDLCDLLLGWSLEPGLQPKDRQALRLCVVLLSDVPHFRLRSSACPWHTAMLLKHMHVHEATRCRLRSLPLCDARTQAADLPRAVRVQALLAW